MQLFAASVTVLQCCIHAATFCTTPQSADSVYSLQFLTEKGGQHLRLLQLVDQLIVPGLDQGRAQANMLPSGNRQQNLLKRDCLDKRLLHYA